MAAYHIPGPPKCPKTMAVSPNLRAYAPKMLGIVEVDGPRSMQNNGPNPLDGLYSAYFGGPDRWTLSGAGRVLLMGSRTLVLHSIWDADLSSIHTNTLEEQINQTIRAIDNMLVQSL